MHKLRVLFLMKFINRKVIIISIIILSLNVSANDYYIVKKGETLSSILYAKNFKPIYGTSGVLVETSKDNHETHFGEIGHDLNILKAVGNSTNAQNIYWKYTWETL